MLTDLRPHEALWQVLVVPDEKTGQIRHSELKLGESFVMAAQTKKGDRKAPFVNYTYLGDDSALDSYVAGLKSKGTTGLGWHYMSA